MKKNCMAHKVLLGSLHFLCGRFRGGAYAATSGWKPYAVALTAGLVASFLFHHEPRLIAARLIVENQILHIQPAVLRERNGMRKQAESCEPSRCSCPALESCWALRSSSLIRRVSAQAVEIGRDYLSLDYGGDTDFRNIRLIHSRPDSAVLAGIIEKFRYGTGITPRLHTKKGDDHVQALWDCYDGNTRFCTGCGAQIEAPDSHPAAGGGRIVLERIHDPIFARYLKHTNR